MLELMFNKRLRENYNEILKFRTVKEIEDFLSSLNEAERDALFAYSYGYAIIDRRRKGFPVTEYFLLHCDDFMPSEKKNIYDRADKHLGIIFLVATIIIMAVRAL